MRALSINLLSGITQLRHRQSDPSRKPKRSVSEREQAIVFWKLHVGRVSDNFVQAGVRT